jgi:hypothetical protein
LELGHPLPVGTQLVLAAKRILPNPGQFHRRRGCQAELGTNERWASSPRSCVKRGRAWSAWANETRMGQTCCRFVHPNFRLASRYSSISTGVPCLISYIWSQALTPSSIRLSGLSKPLGQQLSSLHPTASVGLDDWQRDSIPPSIRLQAQTRPSSLVASSYTVLLTTTLASRSPRRVKHWSTKPPQTLSKWEELDSDDDPR